MDSKVSHYSGLSHIFQHEISSSHLVVKLQTLQEWSLEWRREVRLNLEFTKCILMIQFATPISFSISCTPTIPAFLQVIAAFLSWLPNSMHRDIDIHSVMLGNISVQLSNSVRILGFVFDSHLNMNDQINNVKRKVIVNLINISRIGKKWRKSIYS